MRTPKFMKANVNYTAALLALTASAVLSFIDNFVAAVSEEAGLWQFQVFRTLMALPILIIGAHIFGLSLRPKNSLRLVGRSIVVSIGLLIYFSALGTLPVAQAGAGLFSAPIWVVVLSILMFGERIGIVRVICVVFGFFGALLLLQPDFSGQSIWTLFPLVAGLFYGLGMMLTLRWCKDENPAALAAGIFICIGFGSLVMLGWVSLGTDPQTKTSFLTQPWTTPSIRFLGLTLFQAAGAVIAVSLIAQAYRTGSSDLVAVVEYSFLIFAACWSWLLWGTVTNSSGWLGIAIIIISGAVIVIRSQTPNAIAKIRCKN